MADEYELPDGWSLAGYGTYEGNRENWSNVEAGDPLPSDDDLRDSEYIVISFTDDDDVTEYYTILDGVDGWEGLMDAVDDVADRYGIGSE